MELNVGGWCKFYYGIAHRCLSWRLGACGVGWFLLQKLKTVEGCSTAHPPSVTANFLPLCLHGKLTFKKAFSCTHQSFWSLIKYQPNCQGSPSVRLSLLLLLLLLYQIHWSKGDLRVTNIMINFSFCLWDNTFLF